jgi:hypothetical protein
LDQDNATGGAGGGGSVETEQKAADIKNNATTTSAVAGAGEPQAADSAEEPNSQETEETHGKPQIKEMYWSFGEKHTRLESKYEESDIWKTRRYSDLNLHIKTENYNNGDIVSITLEKEDGEPWFDGTSAIEVSGEISNNELILEKVFEKYASNQS